MVPETEINWQFILDTIQNEKCILFIGPELFKDEEGRSIQDQLMAHLNGSSQKNIQKYYAQDGLFLFKGKAKKTSSYYDIRDFYEGDFGRAEQVFAKLARIPFHFIINVTPDKKCHEVFLSEGIGTRFEYYYKKKEANNAIERPSKGSPVIYNMLGCIDAKNSLILTHNDLFDYFESIFQENSMPTKLKLELKEAHNLIFLGLDFEKWYMQLLLRILYLHNDNYDFERFAANQSVREELKTFCHEQFKIEFIPTRIEEFVDELVERCEAAGITRSLGKTPFTKARMLVREDRLLEALEDLTHYCQENRLEDGLNKINIFNARLKQLENDRDLMSTQEYTIIRNQIRRGINNFIDELEQDL